MRTATEVWSYSIGEIPNKVIAFEHSGKEGVVYLRWRIQTSKGRNWKHESLGFKVRDGRSRILKDKERDAQDAAARKLSELVLGLPIAEVAEHLTVGQAWGVVSDPKTGRYPTDTAHRREVKRSLMYAETVWGTGRTWATLRKADLRSLWRQRIRELRDRGEKGFRGAEVYLSRILAVAEWLRGEELIPATACIAPKHWKQQLADDWREISEARSDYVPSRPRHTQDNMRVILDVAEKIDPRFDLLLALGAELRLGQVLRARRIDLNMNGENPTLAILSRGKKHGVTVYLTPGQIVSAKHALEVGYLRLLESQGGDFPLFPSGQLPGGRKMVDPKAVDRHRDAEPVVQRTVQDWFREAETMAGIPHVDGRSTYGLRRAAVDAAKAEGISREGLKAHGGWSDSQVPDMIYADQEAAGARHEARDVRARIRGEGVTQPVTSPESEVTEC